MKDRVLYEERDEFDQLHPVRGLGYREPEYSRTPLREKSKLRIWIEIFDRDHMRVVWEIPPQRTARRDFEIDLDDLIQVRDRAFPGGTIVVWEGNSEGVGLRTYTNRPTPNRPMSKGKAKKAKNKTVSLTVPTVDVSKVLNLIGAFKV